MPVAFDSPCDRLVPDRHPRSDGRRVAATAPRPGLPRSRDDWSGAACRIYQDATRSHADLGLDFDLAWCGWSVLAVAPSGDPLAATGEREARAILERLGARPFVAQLDRLIAPPVRRCRRRSDVARAAGFDDGRSHARLMQSGPAQRRCASSTARPCWPAPTARWCWPISARTSSRWSRRRATRPAAGGRRGSGEGRTARPRTTSPSTAASARSGSTCGTAEGGRGAARASSRRPTRSSRTSGRAGWTRLGFGDDELARINPRSSTSRSRATGPTGPDAAKPGYDFVAQAVGGLMSITGFPDAAGRCPDQGRASRSATSRRGCSGRSASWLRWWAASESARQPGLARVDVSLLESTLALLINQAQNAFVTGQSAGPPRQCPPEHRAVRGVRHGRPADRRGRRQRAPVAAVLRGDRAAGPGRTIRGLRTNAGRVADREALRAIAGGPLPRATRPRPGWRALEAADVPCGPINDVLSALESPQARARGMDAAVDHPRLGRIRQVGSPITLATGGDGVAANVGAAAAASASTRTRSSASSATTRPAIRRLAHLEGR